MDLPPSIIAIVIVEHTRARYGTGIWIYSALTPVAVPRILRKYNSPASPAPLPYAHWPEPNRDRQLLVSCPRGFDSSGNKRRDESRRGTHECVRHERRNSSVAYPLGQLTR